MKKIISFLKNSKKSPRDEKNHFFLILPGYAPGLFLINRGRKFGTLNFASRRRHGNQRKIHL